MTDKVYVARLRWYGHLQWWEDDSCVKQILEAEAFGQQKLNQVIFVCRTFLLRE